MSDTNIRRFRHSRKGFIVGRVVHEDDTWMHINLARDHMLTYGSECNKGRVDEEGDTITVRKSFLRELAPAAEENIND